MSLPGTPEPRPSSPIPAAIAALLDGTDAPVPGDIERETGQIADQLRVASRRCGSIMPATPHHPGQATR